MTKEELEKEILQTLTKRKAQKLADLAAVSTLFVPDLISLSFDARKEVGFRAAWILEFVTETFPDRFYPFVELFLDSYPSQRNQSCRRHYTKILMGLFSCRMPDMPETTSESIISSTFEWLIDPKTPVAVKVNCLDILFHFSRSYSWIGEELEPQINYLLRDGSAAMQSRGMKILQQLKRMKHLNQ